MSLSEIIKINIEKTISIFIDGVSKKFKIDKNELYKLWSSIDNKELSLKRLKL